MARSKIITASIGDGEVETRNLEVPTSVTLVCQLTNADATVTTTSTANLKVGMTIKHSHVTNVHGDGSIPAGAEILSITNATTFEMNLPATAAYANASIQFDSGVNTNRIANSAITTPKLRDHDQGLEPVWTNLVYTGAANSTHRLIDEYGTRIIAHNGNNGPSGIARVKGTTGHDDFIFAFQPDYNWGFAGVYMTDVAGLPNIDDPGAYPKFYFSDLGNFHQYQLVNNNSNNIRYITFWNGSTNTQVQSASPGSNGGTWYVWRVNGLLRVSDTVGTITLQASGDTRSYVFHNSSQSPHFCRIKQANRLPRQGA